MNCGYITMTTKAQGHSRSPPLREFTIVLSVGQFDTFFFFLEKLTAEVYYAPLTTKL
jgi:hypothetical protein